MVPEDVAVAFFSYCREDSEFALKLAADLKLAGAEVWIDQLDIEPGTPWDRAVEAALTHSPRMLVLLSPVSVNSDNVRDEVSFALSRQKRVIPVLYRDCEVPFRLARLQHVDFRPDYARALTILLRALGVGQAAHTNMPIGAAVAAAAESAVSDAEAEAEAEEQARQQKLAEERRLAAEQAAQVEEARKYAEQARLKKEREAAAEQAAREQEQQRLEAEERARLEQPRREQRAAEQARLEEEARLAAERVRLAQQEQERREAEIKARQEQLRREEQESVERKSMVLEAERQSEREATKQQSHPGKSSPSGAPAAEPARPVVAAKSVPSPAPIKPPKSPEQEVRVPSPLQSQATGLNLTSPKYLAGGAILVVVLGLIIFLLVHRRGPDKPPVGTATENKAAETVAVQPQSQAPAEKPSDSTSPLPAGQSAAAPANASGQDQPKEKANPAATYTKEPPKSNPAGIYTKEIPKSKNLPPQNMADTSFLNSVAGAPGAPLNASNTANTALSPNAVRISQGVSHGLLMHEVAPAYPPLARSARVQGQVVLDVVIGKDGAVKTIKAETGHPMLVPAAIEAVKQWRYKPYFLNGKPVEVNTEVVVNFTLTN